MAKITFHEETPVNTIGELPAVGTKAPAFEVLGAELNTITGTDFAGKNIILNIFPPSIPACAQPPYAPSIRTLPH